MYFNNQVVINQNVFELIEAQWNSKLTKIQAMYEWIDVHVEYFIKFF